MFVKSNKNLYGILTLKCLCDNIYNGANTARSDNKLFAYYLALVLVSYNNRRTFNEKITNYVSSSCNGSIIMCLRF